MVRALKAPNRDEISRSAASDKDVRRETLFHRNFSLTRMADSSDEKARCPT
ncbi:hypothetical protein BSU04_30305 [Caballeronia sordidicola]|uniref:Uncharacterized protein n=1 Tax=Caballeronia sordidicola TaxID=196367 RepID=A0A226WVJ1_CABSO|nr:hypothetical protein BSU04_30305 [Caballeronia sordidicola]